MWPIAQFSADLVTFTEEILNVMFCTVIFEGEVKKICILSEIPSKNLKISERFHNLCSSLNK